MASWLLVCGRYAASRDPDDLVEQFEVDRDATSGRLEPDWNVAPTKPVPGILTRKPRPEEPGEWEQPPLPLRWLRVLSWGLIPSWSTGARTGHRLINARMETAPSKPAFRLGLARRRCLLPADGYYEWYAPDGAANGARKQPFFIRPRDGGVLAMAGLYEIWRDPTRTEDDPDAWLWTCAILTTRAEDALGRLHDRMPLLVEPQRYAAWLDPARQSLRDLERLLVPAAPGRLEAYPVGVEVGDVRNNGPQLTQPVPFEPAQSVGSTATTPEEANRATLF